MSDEIFRVRKVMVMEPASAPLIREREQLTVRAAAIEEMLTSHVAETLGLEDAA